MSTAVFVADGLADQGFDVRDPVLERSHFLKVTNARHAFCEIVISEKGAVTWEYRRFDGRLGPAQITRMAMSVLGVGSTDCVGESLTQRPGRTLKGIVGQALRDRGMQVRVRVLNPDDLCEPDAEVCAMNPAMPSRGEVRINDQGMLGWDCHLSDRAAQNQGIAPDELVKVLAAALVLAEQTG
ncbi:MAG: hypothetical protein ACRDRJ_33125 [Streptosporangiaceae bacterium]